MRALLLPISLALAACTPAAGGQDDNPMAAENAIEEMADAVENAADALDGNMTEAAAPSPAWPAGGTWLWAGDGADGAIWYFEGLESDFTRRPHRVLLRTDERAASNGAYDYSERLAEIDCARHLYRILRTTSYGEAGRATEANERGDGRMVPVDADSVFAQVEEAVCRHAADPSGTSVMNGM